MADSPTARLPGMYRIDCVGCQSVASGDGGHYPKNPGFANGFFVGEFSKFKKSFEPIVEVSGLGHGVGHGLSVPSGDELL